MKNVLFASLISPSKIFFFFARGEVISNNLLQPQSPSKNTARYIILLSFLYQLSISLRRLTLKLQVCVAIVFL